jgi:hypothetical protein
MFLTIDAITNKDKTKTKKKKKSKPFLTIQTVEGENTKVKDKKDHQIIIQF